MDEQTYWQTNERREGRMKKGRGRDGRRKVVGMQFTFLFVEVIDGQKGLCELPLSGDNRH